MKYSMALIGLIFAALVSLPLYADDNPVDDEGAQQFDQLQCVDDATQVCINDACLNSDEIDCQDNCSKLAQEKCQQQINE